ncbi:MAG: M50 family metallopeptidase [Nanoarchaeota archaeon]
MIFTLHEIIDLLLIWIITGIIFLPKNPFSYPRDFLIRFILLVGLSTALHELFHKVFALLLGVKAVLHAFYFGLFFSLILKIIFPQFVILIPGYVSIYSSDPKTTLITAFAGPLANLLLFFFFKWLALKKNSWFYYDLAMLNLWLFVFNMLPIPPLDGYKVFTSLLNLI